MSDARTHLDRRAFLKGAVALASGALVGCERPGMEPGRSLADAGPDLEPGLALTPSCDEGTDENIEGPYYTAGAPTRTGVLGEVPGARLLLAGRVLSLGSCAPIAGASLDVWQADADGVYDLAGYRLRGVFTVGDDGGYSIATVLPGRYLNGASYRPQHIHVKVRAPGRELLTTQLYFPDDPYNDADAFFLPSLLVHPERHGDATLARFDFVLP